MLNILHAIILLGNEYIFKYGKNTMRSGASVISVYLEKCKWFAVNTWNFGRSNIQVIMSMESESSESLFAFDLFLFWGMEIMHWIGYIQTLKDIDALFKWEPKRDIKVYIYIL